MIKTRRIVSGLMLAVAGCLFIVFAVMIAQAAQDQGRLTDQTYQAADATCREQVQKIGPIKEIEAGRIWELNVAVVADKRTALGDASAAIAACPTRVMQTFCLGSGCNDPEGAKPPVNQARRPTSMIMRLALRPGVVPAQTMPGPVAQPVVTAPGQRPPPAAAPAGVPAAQKAVPQPARPATQMPAQPARPGVPPQK